MHMRFSDTAFTIAEQRLVRFAGPEGPDPLQVLKDTFKSTEAKNAIEALKNDPTANAKLKVDLRSADAAKKTEAVHTQMSTILQKEFKHLTTTIRPPRTVPMTPEEAVADINAVLRVAGVKLFSVQLDGGDKIKLVNAPGAVPKEIPDRYKKIPEVETLLSTLDVAQRNALIDVMKDMDTPEAEAEFKAFVDAFKGLTPIRQQMVLQRLTTGRYPERRTDADNKALEPIEKIISAPNSVVGRMITALNTLGGPDSAEVPDKAKPILEKAREAYKKAKDANNQTEMSYIRETTMGRLMLMGIDVSNEEGLLTDPNPKLDLLQVNEKWEMGLHKLMGAIRMISAIMNKVKGKKVENGSDSNKPDTSPEVQKDVKQKGVDLLNKQVVAPKPAKTDADGTAYKVTINKLDATYRFSGGKWEINVGGDQWTNTASGKALYEGATDDGKKINALTQSLLSLVATPGAVTPETQKKSIDEKYKTVEDTVKKDATKLTAEEVKSALDAVQAALKNAPDVDKADLTAKEKTLMDWGKCVEAKGLFEKSKDARTKFDELRKVASTPAALLNTSAEACKTAYTNERIKLPDCSDEVGKFINVEKSVRMETLNKDIVKFEAFIEDKVQKDGNEYFTKMQDKWRGISKTSDAYGKEQWEVRYDRFTSNDRFRCIDSEWKVRDDDKSEFKALSATEGKDSWSDQRKEMFAALIELNKLKPNFEK
jgi:hypothetical protein